MKNTVSPIKIAWAYDRDHRTHPFIKIAIETLLQQGFKVAVFDAGASSGGVDGYELNCVFHFPRRRAKRAEFEKKISHGLIENYCTKLKSRQAKLKKRRQHTVQRRILAHLENLLKRINKWRLVFNEFYLFNVFPAVCYIRSVFAIAIRRPQIVIATRPSAAIPAAIAAKLLG